MFRFEFWISPILVRLLFYRYKNISFFWRICCLYLVNLGVLFLSSLVSSMFQFIGSGFELYLSKDGPSCVSICSYSTYGFLTFIPWSILVSFIFKLDPLGTEGLL